MKKSEKLPNQVKICLENGKKLNNTWNKENELNSIINDCIKIENNVLTINKINENINKCNSIELNINFRPEEKGIEKFIKIIKDFGNISSFSFHKNIISQCFTNILALGIAGDIPIYYNNFLREYAQKYNIPIKQYPKKEKGKKKEKEKKK